MHQEHCNSPQKRHVTTNKDVSASVQVKGELSESFGVGCVMSLWLFNAYMDENMRERLNQESVIWVQE